VNGCRRSNENYQTNNLADVGAGFNAIRRRRLSGCDTTRGSDGRDPFGVREDDLVFQLQAVVERSVSRPEVTELRQLGRALGLVRVVPKAAVSRCSKNSP
jgi:hypothetical protein